MVPLTITRGVKPAGRPRKNTPPWRTSLGDTAQFTLLIHMQI
jgi:hypothetical protein